MSSDETQAQHTQHAFLVARGWFAEHIDLIQQVQAIQLKQKRYTHTPQTKVLEFLVAILAGSKHLQDVSMAAHPLDKDQAVAEAWHQPGWADYSGMSRTLSGLSWDEVRQIAAVLERLNQPYIEAESRLLRSQDQRICLNGDLTGIPVSNTSRTYPNAAYGHMDDDIRLGYQAGVVSLSSLTYRRLWLWIAHHPGDTVSCTQAEALVQAAEARLAQRPRRRTEMLRQRLRACEQQMAQVAKRLATQQRAVERARARLTESEQQRQARQQHLVEVEEVFQTQQRLERPTSRLAQACKRLQAAAQRMQSRQKILCQAQQRLATTATHWTEQQTQLALLQQRFSRLEHENATNLAPVEAEFRLDAGFGTYENIALLIEMGYEVYTKPHSHRVVASLAKQGDNQSA